MNDFQVMLEKANPSELQCTASAYKGLAKRILPPPEVEVYKLYLQRFKLTDTFVNLHEYFHALKS
jgi:hypothetical protein